MAGGSWWTLVAILKEAREFRNWERQREQVACPNCGTPTSMGPRGEVFCRFDGWRGSATR